MLLLCDYVSLRHPQVIENMSAEEKSRTPEVLDTAPQTPDSLVDVDPPLSAWLLEMLPTLG